MDIWRPTYRGHAARTPRFNRASWKSAARRATEQRHPRRRTADTRDGPDIVTNDSRQQSGSVIYRDQLATGYASPRSPDDGMTPDGVWCLWRNCVFGMKFRKKYREVLPGGAHWVLINTKLEKRRLKYICREESVCVCARACVSVRDTTEKPLALNKVDLDSP